MHDNNDPQIDWQLIADLRRMAKEGATVPQLSSEIHKRLDLPEKTWIQDVLYFNEAFYVGIKDGKSIGAWEKLTKHRPAMNDEQINNELLPIILKNQDDWDK